MCSFVIGIGEGRWGCVDGFGGKSVVDWELVLLACNGSVCGLGYSRGA